MVNRLERNKILQRERELIVDYPEVKLLPTTHVLKHSLIEHDINEMRSVDTKSDEFRRLVDVITSLLFYEATKDLPLEEYVVETPICYTIGKRIAGKKQVLVPIERSGNAMEEPAKNIIRKSQTGFLGLYRDEKTLIPHEYYCKMPEDIESSIAFILDPMFATGGSADNAITRLKKLGCKTIRFLCIIAAPQGVDLIQRKHPDVEIYIAQLDKGLNKDCYIVPGLGDAGDRIYGTK